MRSKIFAIVFLCIVIFGVDAQTFGTFESWRQTKLFNAVPTGKWTSPDSFLIANGMTLTKRMVTKSSTAKSGASAVSVKNIKAISGDVFEGYFWYGGIDFDLDSLLPVPINFAPQKLTGYYQYKTGVNDTASIDVDWYKNGQVIGNDFILLTAVSTYKKFELPIVSINGTVPDAVSITFSSGGYLSDTVNANDELILDDLAWENTAGTRINLDNSDAVNVCPNPFNNNIQIALKNIQASAIKISNQLGQTLVQTNNLFTLNNINTSKWPAGMYYVKLYDETGKMLGTKAIVKN